MKPKLGTTAQPAGSSRFRLIGGSLVILILTLILTGIADDLFLAFVDFTLRHGG